MIKKIIFLVLLFFSILGCEKLRMPDGFMNGKNKYFVPYHFYDFEKSSESIKSITGQDSVIVLKMFIPQKEGYRISLLGDSIPILNGDENQCMVKLRIDSVGSNAPSLFEFKVPISDSYINFLDSKEKGLRVYLKGICNVYKGECSELLTEPLCYYDEDDKLFPNPLCEIPLPPPSMW